MLGTFGKNSVWHSPSQKKVNCYWGDFWKETVVSNKRQNGKIEKNWNLKKQLNILIWNRTEFPKRKTAKKTEKKKKTPKTGQIWSMISEKFFCLNKLFHRNTWNMRKKILVFCRFCSNIRIWGNFLSWWTKGHNSFVSVFYQVCQDLATFSLISGDFRARKIFFLGQNRNRLLLHVFPSGVTGETRGQ